MTALPPDIIAAQDAHVDALEELRRWRADTPRVLRESRAKEAATTGRPVPTDPTAGGISLTDYQWISQRGD